MEYTIERVKKEIAGSPAIDRMRMEIVTYLRMLRSARKGKSLCMNFAELRSDVLLDISFKGSSVVMSVRSRHSEERAYMIIDGDGIHLREAPPNEYLIELYKALPGIATSAIDSAEARREMDAYAKALDLVK